MAQANEKASNPVKSTSLAHGVGRRKNAIARVWFSRGRGSVRVNGKDVAHYFDTAIDIKNAQTPLRVVPANVSTNYNIKVNVVGGGKTAQSDAVKLAIARAFVQIDEAFKPALRDHKLLTVDARNKERKKYGQKGARRAFQFVKR